VAIWIGRGREVAAAAAWTSARGVRTVLAGHPREAAAVAPADAFATVGLDDAGAGTSADLAVHTLEGQAEGSFAERRIFLRDADDHAIAVAGALAGGGARVVDLRAGESPRPLPFAVAPYLQTLRHAGYHPDLVPEALASLRRNEYPAAAVLEGAEAPFRVTAV
jgi:hypothetical protein